MGAFIVVEVDPFIEIGLQLFNRFIDLFAKRHLIKLLQDGLVEALADAVGLRMSGLGSGVLDFIDCQEQLEVVPVLTPAIFRAPVCQNAQHRQLVLFHVGQHFVVEHIGGGDRRFGGVEFGMGNLAIGVHIGLLINPPDALQCTDIKSVLRAQVAGVGGVYLATFLVVELLLLKGLNLRLGEHTALAGDFGFESFQAQFEIIQIMAQPDRAHA